jgi:hypothetical protein
MTSSKPVTSSSSRFWNTIFPAKATINQNADTSIEAAEEGKSSDAEERGSGGRGGEEEKESCHDMGTPSSQESAQLNSDGTDAECSDSDFYASPSASLSCPAAPSANSSSDGLPVAVSAVVARLVGTAFDDELGADDEGNEQDRDNNDYSDAVFTTAQLVTHSAAYHRLNPGHDSPTSQVPPPFSGGFRRNDEDDDEDGEGGGDGDTYVFGAPVHSSIGRDTHTGGKEKGENKVEGNDGDSFATPRLPCDISLPKSPSAPVPATPSLPYSMLAPRPGQTLTRAGGGAGHTPFSHNMTPLGVKGPWVRSPGGMMSGRGCGRGDGMSSSTRRPPGNIWDNGLKNQWGPKSDQSGKTYEKEKQEYTQLMNPGKWKRRNSHVLEWVKVADGEFVVKEKGKLKGNFGSCLEGQGAGRKTNDLEWVRLADGSFEVREKPSESNSKKEDSSGNSDENIDSLSLRVFIGKGAGGAGGGGGGGVGDKMSGSMDNSSSSKI